MSSSTRTPSPLPTGRWSSAQGSSSSSSAAGRASTPNGLYAGLNGYSGNHDDGQWAAAKARSAQVRGFPTIQTKNEGFFQRSRRKLTSTLPVFNSPYTPLSADWKDVEKLGRNRWSPGRDNIFSRTRTLVGNLLRKCKFLVVILALITITTLTMSQTSRCFFSFLFWVCCPRWVLVRSMANLQPSPLQLQVYCRQSEAMHISAEAASSSSSLVLMKEVVSWSGKVRENGR